MKVFVLSTLWVLIAFTSFSQTTSQVSLKPDTILVDSNGTPTHFAWRITDQVPLLAEKIIIAESAAAIENAQDSALAICDTMIAKQSILIRSYQAQVDNREQKINNQSIMLQQHEAVERRLNLKIKTMKVKLVVIPVGTLILGYCVGKAIH